MEINRRILFSIIIPVYNAKNTLEETLESIFIQKFNDYEIILVNDGSIDGSDILCENLSKQYKGTVKVLHQKNSGSLVARLNGTSIAQGEYIMYVDADDSLILGTLEDAAKGISEHIDLYLYDYFMDDIGGKSRKLISVFESAKDELFTFKDKKKVSEAFMKGHINTVCACIIKTDLAKKIDLKKIDYKICNGEDRIHKLELIIQAQNIKYIPYAFYYYKWIDSSQGSDLRNGKINQMIINNFKTVWSIEKNNYKLMGFSKEEMNYYDAKKISRLCSLLETSLRQNYLNSRELQQLSKFVSNDNYFKSLNKKSIKKLCRLHVKIEFILLMHEYNNLLLLYCYICKKIRGVKYGE